MNTLTRAIAAELKEHGCRPKWCARREDPLSTGADYQATSPSSTAGPAGRRPSRARWTRHRGYAAPTYAYLAASGPDKSPPDLCGGRWIRGRVRRPHTGFHRVIGDHHDTPPYTWTSCTPASGGLKLPPVRLPGQQPVTLFLNRTTLTADRPERRELLPAGLPRARSRCVEDLPHA